MYMTIGVNKQHLEIFPVIKSVSVDETLKLLLFLCVESLMYYVCVCLCV